MRTIAGYILNMIPYIFVAIPVYVIVRFIILHYSKKDFYWRHELTLLIFILFIVGLTSQTINPKFEFGINGFGIVKSGKYRINLIPFKVLFETYHEVFVHGNINYFLINFLGNIVMFIPLGFFVPLLWNISNKKVLFIGFGSSLFIEFCQIFLIRGTDVDDLMLNTLGTLFGICLYKIFTKKFSHFKSKVQKSPLS